MVMRADSGYGRYRNNKAALWRGLENIRAEYCGRLLRRLLTAATGVAAISAVATTTATTTALARAFVEFFTATASTTTSATPLIFALRTSAAHLGLLATGHHAHAAALLLGVRRAGTITRGERDFEFIEFVPLGIGPIAVGDGQQFLHALAR